MKQRYLIRDTKWACEQLSSKIVLTIFLPFVNMYTLQKYFLKSDFDQYLFINFCVCGPVINFTNI